MNQDLENDISLKTEPVRRTRSSAAPRSSAASKRKKRNQVTAANRVSDFMNQDVDPPLFGLIPEGYEGITYLMLFIFLPKLAGMAFFFFYVSGASFELYSKAGSGGFLLDWAVGYEILATLTLLYIGKKMFGYMFLE